MGASEQVLGCGNRYALVDFNRFGSEKYENIMKKNSTLPVIDLSCCTV